MSTRLLYRDIDKSAPNLASLTTSWLQSGTTPTTILKSSIPVNYATFEGDGIAIDGDECFYTSGDVSGAITRDISDESGSFSESAPNIIFTFSQSHDSSGFTIRFFRNYATSFVITFYSGGTVLLSKTIQNQSLSCIINEPVSGWDKISLKFLSTEGPYQFVKIQKVSFGCEAEIDQYRQFGIAEELNIISDDLPVNTLSFSGMAQFPLFDFEGQEVVPIFRDNAQIGQYYSGEITQNSESNYSIEAENIISKLDDVKFDGGLYSKQVISTLINDISETCGVTILLDETYQNTNLRLTGYIPICSARKALTLIAFALGAIVETNRDGTVCIKPLNLTDEFKLGNTDYSVSTADARIIGNSTFKRSKTITGFDLYKYDYSLDRSRLVKLYDYTSSTGGSDETLTNERIEFSNPVFTGSGAYGIQVTGSNTPVYELHTNYIIVSGRNIVIQGYEMLPNETKLSYRRSDLGANTPDNIVEFKDFTLRLDYYVNQGTNAGIYRKRDQLAQYIRSSGVITGKMILSFDENQNPIEKVGDKVTWETAYSGAFHGIIQKMSLNISENMTADVEVLEWPL